jgi:hypothetical protein
LGLRFQDLPAFALDNPSKPFRADANLRQMLQMLGGLAKALLGDGHPRTHLTNAEADLFGDNP